MASSWFQFFKDAGIDPFYATYYAAIFNENRMTGGMLPDVDRKILREMGIKAIGDQITILRHASKTLPQQHVSPSPALAKKRKIGVDPIVLTPFSPAATMEWPETEASAVESTSSASSDTRKTRNAVFCRILIWVTTLLSCAHGVNHLFEWPGPRTI